MDQTRQRLLIGLLAFLAVATAVVLANVLTVVFFAITVAYVLYPLQTWLRRRGLSRRIASAVSTTVAFLVVVVVATPVAYVLYRRRSELLAVTNQIPETITTAVGGREITVETGPQLDALRDAATQLALDVAVALPRLALELTLFTLLVYAILYRPDPVQTAIYEMTPDKYHDIITRLHRRTRITLFSIYVLQALTGMATGLLSLVFFFTLGYDAWFSLSVVAGILQFIPIIGPSILIAVVAGSEFLANQPVRGITVLALGLVLVGFVPDAIIRTQLSGWAGELSPSLYFVGFVGGVLTVGAIGLIAGPLVVALLVEVVKLLAEQPAPRQQTLDET
jgi:predicted PurR-regulated permease PerM